MSELIGALQRAENALLESPTGTGKTLCLLCAALAWQTAYTAAQHYLLERAVIGADTRARPHTSAQSRLLAAAGEVLDISALAAPGSSAPPDPAAGSMHIKSDPGAARLGADVKPAMRDDSLKVRPKIIYASRTHSQLSQVVRELKNSAYKPRIAVLGSREQLCVHPAVSKQTGSAQNYACRALTRGRRCFHKNHLDEFIERGGTMQSFATAGAALIPTGDGGSRPDGDAVLDIEELAAAGKAQHICSYFLPREPRIQRDADLLLVPYNYLIDPAVRRQALDAVDWRGAVVIFDEAHNIEDVCSEAASFDLTAGDISRCIDELRMAVAPFMTSSAHASPEELEMRQSLKFKPEDALTFHKVLRDIEAKIDAMPSADPKSREGIPGLDARVERGEFIYTFLEQFNINFATLEALTELMDGIVEFLSSRDAVLGLAASVAGVSDSASKSFALEQLRNVFQRIFRDEAQAKEMSQYYRVVIHRPTKATGSAPGGRPLVVGKTLSYWCFSPGVAMKELKSLGVRSVILASGTLSPMPSYAAELRLPFPVMLENPHVIAADQVHLAVVTRGVTDKALNSAYENRDKPEYKRELGVTIAALVRVVPDGVLVFFPSYHALEECTTFWKTDAGGDIWRRITSAKASALLESRAASEFAEQIRAFNTSVDSGRGAVMFAVCRGKVSEGIDFADAHGRAVIVTGLPFPPLKDARVVLKRRILDELAAGGSEDAKSRITGAAWYQQQAFRAVNQAIGRVIRHRKDYGCILLLDERFARDRHSISAWLRPHVHVYEKVGPLIASVSNFFRTAPTTISQLEKADELARVAEQSAEALARDDAATPSADISERAASRQSMESRSVLDGAPPQLGRAVPVGAVKPDPGEPTIQTRFAGGPSSELSKASEPLDGGRTVLDAVARVPARHVHGDTLADTGGPATGVADADAKRVAASAYMAAVRGFLSGTKYEKFCAILRNARTSFREEKTLPTPKVVEIVTAIAEVLGLRSVDTMAEARREALGYMDGFLQFVPIQHHQAVRAVLDKFTAPPTKPVTSGLSGIAGGRAQLAAAPARAPSISSTATSHAGAKRGPTTVAPYDIVTGRGQLLAGAAAAPGSARPATADFDPRKRARASGGAAIVEESKLSSDREAVAPSLDSSISGSTLEPTVTTIAPGVKPDISVTESSPASPERSASAPLPAIGSPVESPASKGVKCAVCREYAMDVGAAKCGHVCCQTCWAGALAIKPACPVCRQFTRPNFVIPIRFN